MQKKRRKVATKDLLKRKLQGASDLARKREQKGESIKLTVRLKKKT